MLGICSEYAQNMDTNMVQIWQIWLRYAAQNMHRICSEHGQDMHQICLSRQDMVRIWSGYGQDMVDIHGYSGYALGYSGYTYQDMFCITK